MIANKKKYALLLLLVFILFAGCQKKEVLPVSEELPGPGIETAAAGKISVCTFNIMWLGHYTKKDDAALAALLSRFDLAIIQEMTAPPIDGIYPDGAAYQADPQAAAFYNAMISKGFSAILSPEDTGPKDEIHNAGSGTEWFIAFYKSETLAPATDLPQGFLDEDRSNHPVYQRVPYAFAFRTKSGNDFVVISVHLVPGDKDDDEIRRQKELNSIFGWIEDNNDAEKDFIILGDMNIYNEEELNSNLPEGWLSLNDECRTTTTSLDSDGNGKPYDQIIFNLENSGNDIDENFDCSPIDLIKSMRPFWTGPGLYPGDPYEHNLFKQYYSDHLPLEFKIKAVADDD